MADMTHYEPKNTHISTDIDPESAPFLEDDDRKQQRDTLKGVSSYPKALRDMLPSGNALLFHIVAFILYSTTTLFLLRTTKDACQACTSDGLWSPAQQAVKYEERQLEAFLDTSKFAGPPTPEVDEAWSDVMKGVNIKILPEEMGQLGMDSIALKDGSGFVGALAVYHELHCIKVLRHWFYQDYYYANFTEDERIQKRSHTEHCLEELRVSAACHGDVSVIPYYWLHSSSSNSTLGMTIRDSQPMHRCVNWDKLHAWTTSRRVDLRDPDLVVPENA